MREALVHEAVVAMDPDADVRAPGGAITVALCGHWEHEPPCPIAPHHTQADRVGADVHLRTLFATEPDSESTVRQLIDGSLSTQWRLIDSRPGVLTADEREHAGRLVAS